MGARSRRSFHKCLKESCVKKANSLIGSGGLNVVQLVLKAGGTRETELKDKA